MVVIKGGGRLVVYISGGPEGLRDVMEGRARRGCSVCRASKFTERKRRQVEIRRRSIGFTHW